MEVVDHPAVAVEDLLQGAGVGGLRGHRVVHREDRHLQLPRPLVQVVQVRARGLRHEAAAVRVEDDRVARRGELAAAGEARGAAARAQHRLGPGHAKQ